MAREMGDLPASGAKEMKFNSRLFFAWLICVPMFLVAVFFLLPKTNCCDDADPKLEMLTTRAGAGQLDAINELYQRAKAEGVQPMEEHWALEGALHGDKRLREVYVEIFKTRIDADRKKRLLAAINGRTEMPGAPCLIATLSEASSVSAVCK